MFFIGIFGCDSKVVPVGRISGAPCPVCGGGGPLSVCRSYSYFHAFFLPLVKYHSHYIATCPGCASAFELDPELGRRLGRGEAVTCAAGDLRLLRDNHAPRCPACGAPQPAGSLFCNQCGAKL